MRTTEAQQKRDGSGIKSSADKCQSSQMNVSVAQELDDNNADSTRENPDNEDEEIVFNFRNVSSEGKILCCTFVSLCIICLLSVPSMLDVLTTY